MNESNMEADIAFTQRSCVSNPFYAYRTRAPTLYACLTVLVGLSV